MKIQYIISSNEARIATSEYPSQNVESCHVFFDDSLTTHDFLSSSRHKQKNQYKCLKAFKRTRNRHWIQMKVQTSKMGNMEESNNNNP